MAQSGGCAENNDSNLYGKHGPTTKQVERCLAVYAISSGRVHFFHFYQWETINWNKGVEGWLYSENKCHFLTDPKGPLKTHP